MQMRFAKALIIVLSFGATLAVYDDAHAENAPLQLISGNTKLDFAPQNRGYLLSSLTDRTKNRDFINADAEKKGLWRIEFRPQNGKDSDAVVLDEATVTVTPQVEQKREQIQLLWKGLSVGSEANATDVTVTISAVKGTSMTDWRIAVRNRVKRIGLWQVDFPRISRLFVSTGGQAALPFGMGMVVDDPVHSESMGFNQRYPEALYSMQFASLSDQGSCLYLGTHDSKAYVKDMTFRRDEAQKGLSYQIRQYPPDMGKAALDYKQPYPCLLGIIDGDWVNAAKYYRKWVLASSDWMRTKKPLVQRTDLPDWYKRLPYWTSFHGIDNDSMAKSEALVKYIGVPAGIHLYNWSVTPFDHRYPEFWPPKPQLKGYIDRYHLEGAKVMPYINAHLMDEMADTWKKDNGAQYAAMMPDGKLDTQLIDATRHMNAMCPATPYWQTKLDGIATQLVRDLNADGIYLDQVSAMAPTLCFNPGHGHPVGGGNHWVRGHAKQIANMRKTVAALKKDVFLTTESGAEPYDFDNYLRVNEGAPFLTPIWQLVYSGYRSSFGFYFYEKPEWKVKFATQYLWGVQIGWAAEHDPKEFPEIVAFEREVARARYAGSDYMSLGEMLRDPQITGDFARVKTTWQNFGTRIPIDWPAVKGSLWRAPDGSVGVAMVNLHTEAQTATVTIPRKEVGFGKGPVRVRVLYPRDMMPAQIIDGDSLSAKITMPASSAALVVLEPVNASTSRVVLKSKP